jgi:hypothetical protein
MLGFALILSALPFFFLSAFWVMIFWGVVAPWVDIRTIGYWESTAATFGLWLALAALALSAGRMASSART